MNYEAMMTGLIALMFAIAFQTGYSDLEQPRYQPDSQTGESSPVLERMGLPVFPLAEPERWFIWVGGLAPAILGTSFLSGLAWAAVGATGSDSVAARAGVLAAVGHLAVSQVPGSGVGARARSRR